MITPSLYHSNMDRHDQNLDFDQPDDILLQQYTAKLKPNQTLSSSSHHEQSLGMHQISAFPTPSGTPSHFDSTNTDRTAQYDDGCYILPPFLCAQYIPLDQYKEIEAMTQHSLQNESYQAQINQQPVLQRWLLGIKQMKERERDELESKKKRLPVTHAKHPFGDLTQIDHSASQSGPITKPAVSNNGDNNPNRNHTLTQTSSFAFETGEDNFSLQPFNSFSFGNDPNSFVDENSSTVFQQQNSQTTTDSTKMNSTSKSHTNTSDLNTLNPTLPPAETQQICPPKWFRTPHNLSQRTSPEFQLDPMMQVSLHVPIFEPEVIKALYLLTAAQPKSTQLINSINNITKTYDSGSLGSTHDEHHAKNERGMGKPGAKQDRRNNAQPISSSTKPTNTASSRHQHNILATSTHSTNNKQLQQMFSSLGLTTTLLAANVASQTLQTVLGFFSSSFSAHRQFYVDLTRFILRSTSLLGQFNDGRCEFYNAPVAGQKGGDSKAVKRTPHYTEFNDNLVIFAKLMARALRDDSGDRSQTVGSGGGDVNRNDDSGTTNTANRSNPYKKDQSQTQTTHSQRHRNAKKGLTRNQNGNPMTQDHIFSDPDPNSLGDFTLPDNATVESMFAEHAIALKRKVGEVKAGIGVEKRIRMMRSLVEWGALLRDVVQKSSIIHTLAKTERAMVDEIVTLRNWQLPAPPSSSDHKHPLRTGIENAGTSTSNNQNISQNSSFVPTRMGDDDNDINRDNVHNNSITTTINHLTQSISQILDPLDSVHLDINLATQLELKLTARIQDRKLRGERAPRRSGR